MSLYTKYEMPKCLASAVVEKSRGQKCDGRTEVQEQLLRNHADKSVMDGLKYKIFRFKVTVPRSKCDETWHCTPPSNNESVYHI